MCKKLKEKVKNLYREFDDYLNANIDTALKVTTALRKVLASPVADILTAIIPGELDDMIRARLVDALGKAITALTILEHCKGSMEIDEKLKCFYEQLNNLDPNLQDAVLHKLASLMVCYLDGQRYKQSKYDLCTQAKYTVTKNENYK